MREWLHTLFGDWRTRRAEKHQQRQWADAVKQFNLMIPQARLVVFASLLKDNPDLAREFRRALGMQDGPRATANTPEERIHTLGGRRAGRVELFR